MEKLPATPEALSGRGTLTHHRGKVVSVEEEEDARVLPSQFLLTLGPLTHSPRDTRWGRVNVGSGRREGRVNGMRFRGPGWSPWDGKRRRHSSVRTGPGPQD